MEVWENHWAQGFLPWTWFPEDKSMTVSMKRCHDVSSWSLWSLYAAMPCLQISRHRSCPILGSMASSESASASDQCWMGVSQSGWWWRPGIQAHSPKSQLQAATIWGGSIVMVVPQARWMVYFLFGISPSINGCLSRGTPILGHLHLNFNLSFQRTSEKIEKSSLELRPFGRWFDRNTSHGWLVLFSLMWNPAYRI